MSPNTNTEHVSPWPNCSIEIFTQSQVDFRLMGNMPISVFGVLTNVINIIVFLDAEMRPSLVNHFLLVLSLSDLLLLICNFFFLIFPVIALKSQSAFLHNAYPLVLWYSYPLALTTQTCGVYLTILVSVHRYLGVCHPFRAKRWVTAGPVKAAIVGSVLFSILINVPVWLELDIKLCYSPVFETHLRSITLTRIKASKVYGIVQKVIIYTFVMFILPFVTLIVVNCRIIMALRQSQNLRLLHASSKKSTCEPPDRMLQTFRLLKKTKYSELFHTFNRLGNFGNLRTPPHLRTATNSVRDRSVTLMLLAIVAIFLLCNCLAFCNNIIEILIYVDKVREDEMGTFELSVEMGNILISLNSSSSILVYLVFSSKYRAIIKHWLGLEIRRKVNGVAVTTAMAAQRALELSMIPDEADSRKRKEERRSLHKRRISALTSSQSDVRVDPDEVSPLPSDQLRRSCRTSSRRKLLRFATIQ